MASSNHHGVQSKHLKYFLALTKVGTGELWCWKLELECSHGSFDSSSDRVSFGSGENRIALLLVSVRVCSIQVQFEFVKFQTFFSINPI